VTQDNTLARSLHDLGLATWFGGSLMGAVGLNGAAAVVDQPAQRLRVANAGWARWTPVNLAGIAAHLAGGAVLLTGNKGRLATQRGVASATVAKATVTGLALAATAHSRPGAHLPALRLPDHRPRCRGRQPGSAAATAPSRPASRRWPTAPEPPSLGWAGQQTRPGSRSRSQHATSAQEP